MIDQDPQTLRYNLAKVGRLCGTSHQNHLLNAARCEILVTKNFVANLDRSPYERLGYSNNLFASDGKLLAIDLRTGLILKHALRQSRGFFRSEFNFRHLDRAFQLQELTLPSIVSALELRKIVVFSQFGNNDPFDYCPVDIRTAEVVVAAVVHDVDETFLGFD